MVRVSTFNTQLLLFSYYTLTYYIIISASTIYIYITAIRGNYTLFLF